MPKHAKSWYRSQTDSWYVEVRGAQTFLGKHPSDAPKPKRSMPLCDLKLRMSGVVLIQGEDNLGGTVRRTLSDLGADLRRIVAYDKRACDPPITLPDDLTIIEEGIKQVHAKLVVIDPISAFLNVNLNSDQGARKALTPLAALAERRNVAFLLVRHLTKGGSSESVIYRGAGRIGIIAAVRSALTIISDPTSSADRFKRLLVQTKTNLGAAPTLEFRTLRPNDCTQIEWLGVSNFDVRDLAPSHAEAHSAFRDAMDVLFLVLSEGAPGKPLFLSRMSTIQPVASQ